VLCSEMLCTLYFIWGSIIASFLIVNEVGGCFDVYFNRMSQHNGQMEFFELKARLSFLMLLTSFGWLCLTAGSDQMAIQRYLGNRM